MSAAGPGKQLQSAPSAPDNRGRSVVALRAAQSVRTSEASGGRRAGQAGTMNDTEVGPHLEFLIVEVGGRRYGLAAADVREIVRAVPPVPLPGTPAVVEGVINLRGRVVPVLDLRRRFGLPARPLEHTDHLVIARAGDRLVALRVDRALDLVRVPAPEVEDVQGVAPAGQAVTRVAKLPGDLVLVQDLGAALSSAEAAALDEALPDGKGGPP
jgi:purine-binding chemotaxis protein CheW